MDKILNIRKDFNMKIEKLLQLKTESNSEVRNIIEVFFNENYVEIYEFNIIVNNEITENFEITYKNILTQLYEFHLTELFTQLTNNLRPYLTNYDIILLETPIGSLIQDLQENSDTKFCQKCGSKTGCNCLDVDISSFSGNSSSSGQQTTSNVHNFDPNKHLNFWINHILCRENDIPVDIINDVIDKVKTKLIWSNVISNITIDDIRDCLKKLKLSIYNKDCSLIYKKITGKIPWISDISLNKLKVIFNKVLLELKKINTERKNKSCYLYYIYKILDIILDNPKEREILDFIYLQKSETCYKNDMIWKKICGNISELEYKPTQRY